MYSFKSFTQERTALYEARDTNKKYTEKEVKGVLDRVQVALEGVESAQMTKLAKRYARLEESMAKMKVKHAELNTVLKGKVQDNFNLEDIVLTRVVDTAQFTLTMAKEIKRADETTITVDQKAIIEELTKLVPYELQEKIEEITKMYTKTIITAAKEPVAKLSVSKEKIKEGILDDIAGLAQKMKAVIKDFLGWGKSYDEKLGVLKAKADGKMK